MARSRQSRILWADRPAGVRPWPPSNAGPLTGTAPSLCIRPGTIWAPCFKASGIKRALAAPGAYPNQAKRKVIYDAAMAACDALDGVADGMISNQATCNAIFDPTVVRCAGGADTGDTCLSDAQIASLEIYNTPAHFNFHMASGLQSFPGCNVWGADLGRTFADSGIMRCSPSSTFLTLGTVQPAAPREPTACRISVRLWTSS